MTSVKRDILITAGATRNPIDAMRFISANSTGRTGAWLADALCIHHHVTVLGSPEALSHCDSTANSAEYGSTADLMNKMHAWVDAHPEGLVIHAAAVGDYAVAPSDGKIASGQSSLTLTLKPTPKIVDAIRGWSAHVDIVSFKAAAPNTDMPQLEAIAAAQGERTDSVAVFANVIGQIESSVLIWTPTETTTFTRRQDALQALVDLVSRV